MPESSMPPAGKRYFDFHEPMETYWGLITSAHDFPLQHEPTFAMERHVACITNRALSMLYTRQHAEAEGDAALHQLHSLHKEAHIHHPLVGTRLAFVSRLRNETLDAMQRIFFPRDIIQEIAYSRPQQTRNTAEDFSVRKWYATHIQLFLDPLVPSREGLLRVGAYQQPLQTVVTEEMLREAMAA